MNDLPECWDEYDPNRHERSEDPSYKRARARAAENALRNRAAYGEALAALRRARSLTQVAVAARLGAAQGEVSRIEHQTDLLLSTLARYVESMDGTLALLVRFGDGQTVELGAVIDDLLNEQLVDEAIVAADLGTVIELAGFHARFAYKEEEFRAVRSA